jgi:hypothetical protein
MKYTTVVRKVFLAKRAFDKPLLVATPYDSVYFQYMENKAMSQQIGFPKLASLNPQPAVARERRRD